VSDLKNYYLKILEYKDIPNIFLKKLSEIYIYYRIGVYYNCEGFKEKAKDYFKRGDDLYNELYRELNFEENLKRDDLLRLQTTKFHHILAIILTKVNLYQKSEDHLEEIEKVSEDIYQIMISYYNLGSIYKKKGNLDKAEEKYKELINLHSKDILAKNTQLVGGANFHLGTIYYKLNNKEKAKYHFEECLKFIPNHRKARENLENL
jgi:tetratricopeptide (TPR) repeat protein